MLEIFVKLFRALRLKIRDDLFPVARLRARMGYG